MRQVTLAILLRGSRAEDTQREWQMRKVMKGRCAKAPESSFCPINLSHCSTKLHLSHTMQLEKKFNFTSLGFFFRIRKQFWLLRPPESRLQPHQASIVPWGIKAASNSLKLRPLIHQTLRPRQSFVPHHQRWQPSGNFWMTMSSNPMLRRYYPCL